MSSGPLTIIFSGHKHDNNTGKKQLAIDVKERRPQSLGKIIL